jgi:DNA polymerase (family 10)
VEKDLKNGEVADVLADISWLLELEGDDAYRIRAYRKAAQSIEGLDGDVNAYYREGRLRDIPGVGESIARTIAELLDTGRSGLYETLKKEIPPELYEVIEVPGIGRRTALKVHSALGAKTVEDFRRAAKSHRIRKVRGMGEVTEKKILEAIDRYRDRQGETRAPIFRARAIARELMGYFTGCEGLVRAEVAGSLRRWKTMVGNVDILAVAADPAAIVDCFCHTPISKVVKERGERHARITTRYRVDATLYVARPEDYGFRLLWDTGSHKHLELLAGYAGERGVKLGSDGYVVEATGERKTFPTEEEVYASLGLEYVTPELREGTGEIAAARQGTLPDLITQESIKGDLHVHTEWSDGADSIQDMAMAARAMGYEYIALCDHSQSLHIANGLSIEKLRSQMVAIDEINDTVENFTILKGSEADILADGSLDLPDDVLGDLDIVVGSVHTNMRQESDAITRRVLTALENEHLTILAHPTSRILGRREPTALDIDRMIEVAKEHDKVLEVNAYPDRLDLSDENVRKAMDAGVMICIDTDAHSIPELCFIEYGVHNARRGWATRARTLNTLSYDALREYLDRH